MYEFQYQNFQAKIKYVFQKIGLQIYFNQDIQLVVFVMMDKEGKVMELIKLIKRRMKIKIIELDSCGSPLSLSF